MFTSFREDEDPEGIKREEKAYEASRYFFSSLFKEHGEKPLYDNKDQRISSVNQNTKENFNDIVNNQNNKNDENALIKNSNLNNYYMTNNPTIKTLDWATKNWNNTKIAYNVGLVGKKYRNISSTSQRFADKLPLNSDKTDPASKRGAFRHSLWQASITSKYGSKTAEEIGNIHEKDINVDLSKRVFKSAEDADVVVDLLNNKIGREIGFHNRTKNIKYLAQQILIYYYNNGLYSAEKNNNGFWYVDKRKIDRNTYNKIMNIFSLADDYGFLPNEDQNINVTDIIGPINNYIRNFLYFK